MSSSDRQLQRSRAASSLDVVSDGRRLLREMAGWVFPVVATGCAVVLGLVLLVNMLS